MIRSLHMPALICVALLLTGCGFRPLYSETVSNAETVTSLEKIRVSGASTKTDAVFRNFLLDRIAPAGAPDKYEYELGFRLDERQIGSGVRIDASVTRFNLQLSASYQVKDAKTRDVVYSGNSRSVVAYDVLRSQFATVIERENARERAAREIANDIVLRLSLFFERQAEQELAAQTTEAAPADAP